MNSFDHAVVNFLNGFAHRSHAFDAFVFELSDNNLVKTAFITALMYWAWFRRSAKIVEDRRYLIWGVAACLLAVITARTLSHVVPYRERPLRDPAIHFQLPYETSEASLLHWSSFPSDHAAVFFALATSVFFVSRAAGLLALAHAFFIISLTRIYLGYHYPTDVLAGAIIGAGLASLALLPNFRRKATDPALRWMEYSPGTFYACLFLVMLQITTSFESLRHVGKYLMSAAGLDFAH